MKRILFVLTLILTLAGASHVVRAAGSDGIAAVVNDEPITMSDVADRMRLLMITSGMQDVPEVREKVRPQVVNMLIDETLRLQEIAREKVTIDEAMVEAAFTDIAKQNNMEPAQFSEALRRSKVSEKSLRQQLRAQVAWNIFVEQKLMGSVQVTEYDVDSMEQLIKANFGKTEYLAAEIFLPVDSTSAEGDVRALADRLVKQLRGGDVRFSALAGQFSQAAGASKGGDLGWVQEGQLMPEVAAALAALQKGEVTDPVRSVMGYHILLLRESRAAAAETMPTRDQIFNRLGNINLDRAQRRHFMNLKATAFIERRDS
jgi:peptidyl-prolyl cis-trans isomerase SurA